ncbi:hypothetical protein R1sor_020920 [Riccia sorocarpa]|uniref:Retrovirus-related Pol polyprotein from transposon TNT 1-94-like beta-barrel domain-containing protein n=1 Tax=Riccia sorocarpa TaxID=122646 RepID=A0ABD3GJS9_9MARC
MPPGLEVSIFLRTVKDLANELEEYGELLDDDLIVDQILNSLPEANDQFVSRQTDGDKLPSLAKLEQRLQAEEDRKKRREDTHTDEVLAVRFRRDKKQFKPKLGPCNRCSLPGQLAKDCYIDLDRLIAIRKEKEALAVLSERGTTSEKGSTDEQGKESESSDEDLELPGLAEALAALAVEDDDPMWLIDSGASSHLTNLSTALTTVKLANHISFVKSAGGEKHAVEGSGDVIFNINGIKFDNVLYIPSLKRNLLSVGRIADKDNLVIFDKNQCIVVSKLDPITVLARAYRDRAVPTQCEGISTRSP